MKKILIIILILIILFIIGIFSISFLVNSWVTNEDSTKINRDTEVNLNNNIEKELEKELNN